MRQKNVLVHVSNHCKVAIEEIIIGNNIFVFLFYILAHSGTFQTLLHKPIHYHYYLFDCKRKKSQQSLSLRTCNLLSKYYRRNVIVLKQKIESELFYHQKLVQNVKNCISTLKTRNAPLLFCLFHLKIRYLWLPQYTALFDEYKKWPLRNNMWMLNVFSFICLSFSVTWSFIYCHTHKVVFPTLQHKDFLDAIEKI